MSCPTKAKGFSLIELMLALGVAAVLMVAAFVIYNQVSEASKINAIQAQVRTISAGIRTLFPHGDYGALTNRVAVDANLVDESMREDPTNPDSRLRNSWGGTLVISGTDESTATGVCGPSAGGARCPYFRIVINSVPSKACVDMITAMGGEYEIVWAIHGGGTSVSENLLDEKGQPDIDRVVHACNDADRVNLRFVGR